MKSFIALFLIAIISCSSNSPILKEKEPIDIIKCIISNQDLINQFKEIIIKMEEVIKNKDLSGLVSLLNLFSMVEEVKECFEKIPDEPQLEEKIDDKEPVLKEVEIEDFLYDYFKCIEKSILERESFTESIHILYSNCRNNLTTINIEIIKKARESYFMEACQETLSRFINSFLICQEIYLCVLDVNDC